MAEGTSWPPGWFPDPTGRHDHRWWDGAAWTQHVADAGIAGLDPLPDRSGPQSQGDLPGRHDGPGAGAAPAPSSSDPVAGAALATGLVALLLAVIPWFGLVLPVAAVVLGLVARSRIRTSQRRGDGLAIAGLVLGTVSLLLALVVTIVATVLLSGSGTELMGAFGEYVACLEVRSADECRAAFEESLARILE